MKIVKVLFILLLGFIPSFSSAQVDILKWPEFEERYLNPKDDTVRVLNLWATWCRPCVEELPYFEDANREYAPRKVKVVLVSVDFSSDYDSKLLPFLKKKKIASEVVLLDEQDANAWIDKISPEWSGAIPATLILNPEKGIHTFKEGSFEREELFNLIEKSL